MNNKSSILNALKSFIFILNISFSITLILRLIKLNILPNKYLIILSLFILLINIIICILIKLNQKIFKFIGIILNIALLISSMLVISFFNTTDNLLEIYFDNYNMEISTYNVIVLIDSPYKDLKELNNKKIGYIQNEKNILNNLKININKNSKSFNDIFYLMESLINKELDAIIINEAYLSIIEEDINDLNSKIRILYTFDISTKVENTNPSISLKPINIYISGSDSESKVIVNKSRSDVNMIVTINPRTNEILLTSIPRDYYVEVYGKTGLKDKLTHSGIYGLETSTKTVANLFNINIDYSIKIGFASVEKIVDLVGGVDIYSDMSFTSIRFPDLKVNTGLNHFNGQNALEFARERYAYENGDRHRIQNQQQVLEAIFKKLITNSSLLLKYDELLTSLNELYRTNIPKKVISLYVKKQLEDNKKWQFYTFSVDGTNTKLPTYTSPQNKRYVMLPNDEDIKQASNKINELLNK